MSGGFKEREQAFENKYKHDQDLQFRCAIKAARLFGLWAAEKLGLSGADADAYAEQVVDADFEEVGYEDVLRKVQGDFTVREITMEDSLLRKEYLHFLEQAKLDIMAAEK